ncbi:MAG: hypothetical protein ACO29V_05610 [Limnohabitans sp.]
MSTTPVPNDKLSGWYFMLQHCKYVLQDRINTAEINGWGSDYDRAHLERLEDMEQFVKMSWDAYMDSLLDRAKAAVHGFEPWEANNDG